MKMFEVQRRVESLRIVQVLWENIFWRAQNRIFSKISKSWPYDMKKLSSEKKCKKITKSMKKEGLSRISNFASLYFYLDVWGEE